MGRPRDPNRQTFHFSITRRHTHYGAGVAGLAFDLFPTRWILSHPSAFQTREARNHVGAAPMLAVSHNVYSVEYKMQYSIAVEVLA